jgi:hypothetical protein
MEVTDDWVQYVIDKPMAADPGTIFNYSSGACCRRSVLQNVRGRRIETVSAIRNLGGS